MHNSKYQNNTAQVIRTYKKNSLLDNKSYSLIVVCKIVISVGIYYNDNNKRIQEV